MIKNFLRLAGVKTEKEFYKKFPTEESFFKAYPEAEMLRYAAMGGYYQEGGQPPMMEQAPQEAPQQEGQDQMQQIIQMIMQALQQGISPEEILASLVEKGVPEEQASQLIQAVMQKVQEQPSPEEQMMEEEQMAQQMQIGGVIATPQEEGLENQPVMKDGGNYSGTYSAGVYYKKGGSYLPSYSQMMDYVGKQTDMFANDDDIACFCGD
jgi:hypothetical protein